MGVSRAATGIGPITRAVPINALFAKYVTQPTPPFLETIAPIEEAGYIPGVMSAARCTLAAAEDAKKFGDLKDDPLPLKDTVFLMKYSAEDTEPALYADMNDKAYDKDRKKIAPYGPYMIGTVKAMGKTEPYGNTSVFRGVKLDLRADYVEGREFTWHGFCSATKSIKVLESPMFCGQTGPRTFFIINLTQGQARDITRYSMMPGEDEVLLPPGCTFRVTSVLAQGPELTIIHVEELPSDYWIMNLHSSYRDPSIIMVRTTARVSHDGKKHASVFQ